MRLRWRTFKNYTLNCFINEEDGDEGEDIVVSMKSDIRPFTSDPSEKVANNKFKWAK